ncbi:MAG TPA: hypothetical protein PLS81_05840 [Deltaproteobacteria bacterium]|nr:hypothetical protein [Deltaproteobacteria bacterium]HPP81200.1 hypothetical protein [Deltaproteobacteria bacterium]
MLPEVLLITIFIYGNLVPVNVMEARNYIAAREMAAGRSWLLPTMNGEIRIAKPPCPHGSPRPSCGGLGPMAISSCTG